MKQKNKVYGTFTDLLKQDPRVDAIFLTGSARNGGTTIFSDLDLWVVFSSEANLNSFCAGIHDFSGKVAKVRGIYSCTAHHFFVVYEPSIQIDLNLITSAQFYSIRNNKNIFVYDRKLFLKNSKSSSNYTSKQNEARKLIFHGYTSLERGISKYLRGDYFATTRFLERIREDIVIPLFNTVGILKMKSPINLNIEKLNDSISNSFMKTYTAPNKSKCADGIKATSQLLSIIANMLKIEDFKDYMIKFSKLDI